jgi:hypothetical protein
LNPLSDGFNRALHGLRTGDQRSLYTGALLVAVGLWRRSRTRERRELIYRRELKEGQAIVIRPSVAGGNRIVVSQEMATELKPLSRRKSRARLR